MAAKIK